LLIGLLALPGAASAATIQVTTTDDEFGTDAPCSLREAVQSANTNADFGGCLRTGAGGKDTIDLDGGERYVRTRTGIDDTNDSGDLDISGQTIIEVVGQGKAILDGNDMDRVIEVLADGQLTASRLTITNGTMSGTQGGRGGGGISSLGRLSLTSSLLFDNAADAGPSGCGCGGGIESRGRMHLEKVTLNHNEGQFEGGGIYAAGPNETVDRSTIAGNLSFTAGGIDAFDSLTVTKSTISANEATDGNGGGVFVGTSDDEGVTLINSTLSGNRATDGGGGLFRFSGHVHLNGVTVSGNTADLGADATGHGGGLDGGTFGTSVPLFKFQNSIIAGNTDQNPTDPAPDCARLDSTGFGHRDLLGLGGGCQPGSGDLTTADPRLGPLADNGGPTATLKLKRGSPAIGRANRITAPKQDQRGVKRDAHPDIGAYER
jgi:CSLREA domain-containing protein